MNERLDNTAPERAILERLRAMPVDDFARLHARTQNAARKARILYDGKLIPFSYMPFIISNEHHKRLRVMCVALLEAMRMIPELYLRDRDVRSTLPLAPSEDEILREVWQGEAPQRESCIARFDADWANARKLGINQLLFFETNAAAAGGFYYEPAISKVLQEHVFPRVFTPAQRRHLRHDVDMRDMLSETMLRQVKLVGGRSQSLGVLDSDPGEADWEEVPEIVRGLEKRGWRAGYFDPRELEARKDGIYVRGKRFEVFYRYIQLRDILSLPGKKKRFDGIREAFRQGRVVPGMSGDFDHKSLWEVLQSERFAKWFPARLRNRFVQHIPWTRLLRDIKTDSPFGEEVELLRFVRKNQELLILKPNRELGGAGIHFGSRVTSRDWNRLIDAAATSEFGWVAQTRIFSHRKLVPTVRHNRLDPQPMYFAQGIFCDGHSTATFGRLCPRPVVNVAQGGLAAPGFVWR